MTSSGPRRAAHLVGCGLLVGLLLASCSGGGGGGDARSDADPSVTTVAAREVGVLTVKSLHSPTGEQYTYDTSGDTITVSAPKSNHAVELAADLEDGKGVIGEAFWETGQTRRSDQQVCVRLDSVVDASTTRAAQELLDEPTLRQLPGVALRVSPGVDGAPTYALTVTQRLKDAAIWGFEVTGLRIDTADDFSSAEATVLGTVDFENVVGRVEKLGTPEMATDMKPPPWNLCARVIGTTVTLKLWSGGSSAPSWSDPEATGEVKLPRQWVFDGYAGGYEQGLAPGRTSKFVGLRVTSPY
jgi:hypothetical protein